MVVASSNAQAKNISSADVKARTIHNAAGMRVQELTNAKTRPGNKQAQLTRLWDAVHVLIIEEVSMVAAAVYNMLDCRSMHGRSRTHDVSEATYKKANHHFGRVPIVIHLGDFIQLSPTANIGLIEDVNGKRDDGSYRFPEPPSLEVQHAIRVFGNIAHVFELRGTKRFKAGDPLIEFLQCMRAGERLRSEVWNTFRETYASDNRGILDPRHEQPKFMHGYGMAMYWETIARWITKRARRDAQALGVPCVFMQAVDECNTIDRSAALRLLNIPNLHTTGNIHGVLPAHVGMRVRFTMKLNSRLGLVQEQRATIVDFLFKEEDRARYDACSPGELFRPRFLPAGIWLDVDDFTESPIRQDVLPLVISPSEETYIHSLEPLASHVVAWARQKQLKRAQSLLLLDPAQTEFMWRSSETHTVKRTGFGLTHADFFTFTASQGQTLRRGVTIDCARQEPRGNTGASDDQWWLHLYVMFSRATCMEDMLLLRPPERAMIERGPPEHVRKALEGFEQKINSSTEAAAALAASMGMDMPG